MRIQSLVREQDRLIVVDIEVSFVPGLPTIQFLGLPDQVIKESIHRIKSALRMQGFDFPKAQQVLVNIRPNHLKKSSRGLELAVAAAILWNTDQIPAPNQENVLIYGELGLGGEVHEPDDLCKDFEAEASEVVITGQGGQMDVSFPRMVVSSLAELKDPLYMAAAPPKFAIERPQVGLSLNYSARQSQWLKISALGEHSSLLAGPSGSGKSTMAKTLWSLLKEPTAEDMKVIFKNSRGSSDVPPSWRPLVHPHHSISPIGLIGGGVPPFPGEFSRAHKGLLILDELLEFHTRAQETMREPMEDFCVRLRRGRFVNEYPAEALVIATTNLCPCGQWLPKSSVICRRSLKKCQSYLERLSGPMVDRFQTLYFTKKNESGSQQSGEQILSHLKEAFKFRQQRSEQDHRYRKLSSRWDKEELSQDVEEFYLRHLFPREMGLHRRELSTLRVARTLADLSFSERIETSHLEEALGWTYHPFEALKNMGC